MPKLFKDPAVVIGIGEMAGVFSRGLLRLGIPLYPVLRGSDINQLGQSLPEPELVLLAVAEKDLHSALDSIPPQWASQLVLLQNELLPKDWKAHQLENPTVISVWFEKKKGQDYKVLIPSPVYGPKGALIADALKCMDIPTKILSSPDELLFQLVLKNVYILTTNIAGLISKGTVEDLWNNHQQLAREVANDVMDIQEWLTGTKFNRNLLIDGMVEAIHGDLNHQCMGRSAPARLAGAIANADKAKLAAPKLREIYSQQK